MTLVNIIRVLQTLLNQNNSEAGCETEAEKYKTLATKTSVEMINWKI